MKIILIKDVENLGLKYDIIDVKPGYARNFLIPNRLASLATQKEREELKQVLENKNTEEKIIVKQAKEIVQKLKITKLALKVKVGTGNKLFGSINNQNLSEEFLKLGIKIDKKYIKIPGNKIKKIGKYSAKIRLHRFVEEEFEFEVVSI